jgi:hopanoid C-3 methylase
MKILFVQPPTNPHVWGGDAIFVLEPLWAEYLSAGVRERHDTRLLDMRRETVPFEAVLSDFRPDVVAMTAYTVDVNTVKGLAKRTRDFDPSIRVVLGGYFANGNARQLQGTSIDVVVPGEGVNTLRELVDTWQDRSLNADLRGIPGLAFPLDGQMHTTPTRPWPSLDSYRHPDRRLSAHVRDRYFDKWMKPVASIMSSYSCPFRCEFCCLWPTTGGKYLSRSPESLVAEIASIEEDNVWFTDDEAFIDGPRMERVAKLLDAQGIRKQYFFMTRSDSIRRNAPRFELWARAGLKRVMVGFESIRAPDLVAFNKEATVADNDEAIAILQRNGLEINSNFVLTQDYQAHDFENLQRYVDAKELSLPLYFILTPFPGTVLHERVKQGIFLHDYDFYDLLHTVLPTALPLREFYAHFSKLYGAIEPLRRGIQGYGDSLDELVVRNVRKVLESMRPGQQLPSNIVGA